MSAVETVPARAARTLLLASHRLSGDHTSRLTRKALQRTVEQMGFVQVDTISVVERAHHHILFSRHEQYDKRMLAKLLEQDRSLFEHWTHDASIIPRKWFPCWRRRFEKYREHGLKSNPWWNKRMGGRAEQVIAHVRERIEREGPLMSKDFEHDRNGESGNWWGWKPQKAALEFLWRTGDVSVHGRRNFHKVYELTERMFPEELKQPIPDEQAHLDWACREALDRLGIATPSEIARFFAAVSLQDVRQWCRNAMSRGEVVPVLAESADGSKPKPAVAQPDWKQRTRRAPQPPQIMRLLSPFDPVIRDRARLKRLFDFEYTFEGFVPEAKRKFGYYVLPILEGDQLVGRLDSKVHRDREELEIRGIWWEPKIKLTAARRRMFDDALDSFAAFVGATTIVLP